MTDRKRVDEALAARARQQAVAAELGERALMLNHAGLVAAEAVEVAEALGTTTPTPESDELMLAVGVGWESGAVGAGIKAEGGYLKCRMCPLLGVPATFGLALIRTSVSRPS